METGLMVFGFEGREVRAVSINGEPWFVAKDVAETLRYSNPQKAVRDHCKYRRPAGVNESFTLDPQTVIIPEGDAYRLVIRSHMPEAERFETWLMDKVVPQIRKTGAYAVAPAPQFKVPQTYPEALRELADTWEKNQALEAKVQVLAPKAEFHDRVTEAVNCEEIGEFAKALGTGQNRFFKWLREQKILMENNHPYQQHLDAGHFKVEERTRVDKNKQQRTYFVTVITGKGQTYLHRRWVQAGNGVQMKLEAPSSDERLLN